MQARVRGGGECADPGYCHGDHGKGKQAQRKVVRRARRTVGVKQQPDAARDDGSAEGHGDSCGPTTARCFADRAGEGPWIMALSDGIVVGVAL